jgi:hypothetical protein
LAYSLSISLGKMKRITSALLLCMPLLVMAQKADYPKNYFQSPIDAPLLLAGNFGELRPNHFHAGLDITTSGKEGVAIFAAAEGYVSRIRVSPFGYGKALYVTHPNGYTTVYGHLSNFSKDIGLYAEQQQYQAEIFEIDITVEPGKLPVKKGEIIARSGNSGSSGGPHLHFEVRDTKTEDAINPLLFGFAVADKVAPVIVQAAIIPLDADARINGKNEKKLIPLKLLKGIYVPQNPADSMPRVSGRIGFALETYDKESTPHGKNGTYSVSLAINNSPVYAHRLERIPFEHSRYINCFTHYATQLSSKTWLQCSYLPPNNLLPVYDTVVNHGELIPEQNKRYTLRYTASDVNGNKATASFSVRGEKSTHTPVIQTTPFVQIIPWDTSVTFESTGEWIAEFPARSVYDHTPFRCAFNNKDPARPRITLYNNTLPLHKPCTLSIAVKNTEQQLAKAVICEETTPGKAVRYNAVTTTVQNGYATAFIKNFGVYVVRYDTIAPAITPSNFDLKGKTQKNLSALSALQFTISDNLSGIKTYRATINGKWILADYDAKNKRLTIDHSKYKGQGSCLIRIEITDKCGNLKVYEKTATL